MTGLKFLPVSLEECRKAGWDELDIIIVTGDAYIDHPSFGAAIIGRYLVANGFRVGVIPQPDWRSDRDFLSLGRPRLFFGVTAGNMDSMVNHYTAQKKIRSTDAYSPEGKPGLRPDRATLVYTQKLKQLFKQVPVVLGGIEASLRRIPHYDFWSDRVRNSVLLDSKADILIYGMGERVVLEVARNYAEEKDSDEMKDIPGTVVTAAVLPEEGFLLPDYEEVADPKRFLKMNRLFQQKHLTTTLYQKSGLRYLKHNPPSKPLEGQELDMAYDLSYSRRPHPMYGKKAIPAFEQIKLSVTSHRGCLGGCHFCALNYHQGKQIRSRSKDSILKEVKRISNEEYFRGTISDIGGPSANMYGMECQVTDCKRSSCLMPEICEKLETDHSQYLDLLEAVRGKEKINNVFIASGIRSDLALRSESFNRALVKYYTGGRLKLAPEYKNNRVLKLMNKPDFSVFEEHVSLFGSLCKKYGMNYQVIPYIMVGHPGSNLKNAVDLALYLKEQNLKLKQVQEFTPTPMTVSSCMYYTGYDFYSSEKIEVPKGREIRLQKAIVQWFIPENRKYVIEALRKARKKEYLPIFLKSSNRGKYRR